MQQYVTVHAADIVRLMGVPTTTIDITGLCAQDDTATESYRVKKTLYRKGEIDSGADYFLKLKTKPAHYFTSFSFLSNLKTFFNV